MNYSNIDSLESYRARVMTSGRQREHGTEQAATDHTNNDHKKQRHSDRLSTQTKNGGSGIDDTAVVPVVPSPRASSTLALAYGTPTLPELQSVNGLPARSTVFACNQSLPEFSPHMYSGMTRTKMPGPARVGRGNAGETDDERSNGMSTTGTSALTVANQINHMSLVPFQTTRNDVLMSAPARNDQYPGMSPSSNNLLLLNELMRRHQQDERDKQQRQQQIQALQWFRARNGFRQPHGMILPPTLFESRRPRPPEPLLRHGSTRTGDPAMRDPNTATIVTSQRPSQILVHSDPTIPLETETASRTSRLPMIVAHPMDDSKLSDHQSYLRKQMEVFQASEADTQTRVRGRTNAICIGQVGIRCRHCAHLPIQRRYMGSTYFPASLLGFYQAAQNITFNVENVPN